MLSEQFFRPFVEADFQVDQGIPGFHPLEKRFDQKGVEDAESSDIPGSVVQLQCHYNQAHLKVVHHQEMLPRSSTLTRYLFDLLVFV